MKTRTWFAYVLPRVLLLGAALCAAHSAVAQTPLPAGVARVVEVEGISEYRLANGLQILLVPDNSKPTTTVNVTYRVGSRHESYGETGMAHLLEHLVFKGTPTTKNAFGEFTKRGLRANGTTSWDRTNYFASFAANDDNLKWYLSWQADVMVNSFIARADLDTEMTVVRNEMESGENNPNSILFQRLLGTMYDWHNYGKSTIGARSDVENVDITRLQAFYKLHYQPDNATLIVAGRFAPDQVLAWVAQSFGVIPKPSRVLPPTYTLDPAQDGERSVTVRRVGGAPLIYVGFHVPPASHPDYAAAALLSQVLGDAPGGRLHKRLVDTQMAAGAFGTVLGTAEPGMLVIGAALAPTHDVQKVRAEIAAVVDELGSKPITTEELERARTQWLNAWEQGFNDPETVGVQISSAIAKGDWRLYFLERNRLRAAGLADVQRVAKERLTADNRTVALYVPTAQPQRAPAPQRVDVAAQLKDFKGDATVAVAEAFEATPANLDARTQQRVLTSGMRVGLLPKSTRGKVVQARVALHVGDEKSLFNQETVAAMMGATLDKGVNDAQGSLTRQQISDSFDKLRAEVGFSVDGQALVVAITTVRDNLPAAISLVGRILRYPTFPKDAIEEARSQWLTGIESQRKEPGAVVANALERHGNPYRKGDVRYVSTFEEQEADVKAVQVSQVQAFHKRFVSAARSEFAAVGDFDVAAVNAALDKAFADWQKPAGGALPHVRVPNPLVAVPPVRLMLPAPDKQNANLHVVLSLPVNDSHVDYAALMAANYIFGGGGNSRLWQRLREKEGFSYDVRSYINWNNIDLNSTWTSTAIFAPQNQAKVEAAWREELALSLKDGFTAAELKDAVQGLLASRRLNRSQDANVVFQLQNNQYLQRPFEASQKTDDALAKLTLDQVNAVWKKYIAADKLAVAWGGDFKAP
jgi:zinc protease